MDYSPITQFLMECMAQALMELLRERPFSSISITELTKKAGVSRMTFYRNYNSVEEVFEKYNDYLFRCYHEEVLAHSKHASFIQKENILIAFEFFHRYAEYITCLMNNNFGGSIREKIIENELSLSLSSKNDDESRYLTIAYANTIFGILTAWLQGGMKEQPEMLADLICNLYQDKLRRF